VGSIVAHEFRSCPDPLASRLMSLLISPRALAAVFSTGGYPPIPWVGEEGLGYRPEWHSPDGEYRTTDFGNIDWYAVVAAAIAVLFGLLSLYLYLRPRPQKVPLFSTRTTSVVTEVPGSYPKLKVLYDNREVGSLTITKLAFWNAGTGTINASDIPPGDPIRVQVDPPSSILDGRVLDSVHPQGNRFDFQVTSPSSTVPITFDYADRGQGVAIEILHTAQPGEGVKVLGSVKGGVAPQRFEETKTARLMPNFPLLSFAIVTFVWLAIVVILPKPTGLLLDAAPFLEILPLVLAWILAVRYVRRWQGIPAKLLVIESSQ
jgi:hypothetical protein